MRTLLHLFFFKASIILPPKPDKDITRKEKCSSVSIMNIDAKILNKINSKCKVQHWKVEFIPEI